MRQAWVTSCPEGVCWWTEGVAEKKAKRQEWSKQAFFPVFWGKLDFAKKNPETQFVPMKLHFSAILRKIYVSKFDFNENLVLGDPFYVTFINFSFKL